MSEAGPSRRRHDVETQTQTQSATMNGTRKRRRKTLGDDVFARQDPEEVERMAQGYRDLQHTADGGLRERPRLKTQTSRQTLRTPRSMT